jgi:Rps23 Pro-64 3,4-dihydroxylase Tpa1-like proline 4-hydroxylase
MVSVIEFNNLKRKIKRARTVKVLDRYTKQLDQWLIEIQAANRPTFRHSYVYDQYEKRLLARSGLL